MKTLAAAKAAKRELPLNTTGCRLSTFVFVHLPVAGFIPLIGLVELANKSLISSTLLGDIMFRPEQQQQKMRGRRADLTLPVDLNIADSTGSTILTQLFDKGGGLSILAGRLSHSKHTLTQIVDLFAANDEGECAMGKLANACNQPGRMGWPTYATILPPLETRMLPQRLLAAWQAARGPLLRSGHSRQQKKDERANSLLSFHG
jgi:hypothetical protein